MLVYKLDEAVSLGVEFDRYDGDRWVYRWTVTADGETWSGDDLRSGSTTMDRPEPLGKMLGALAGFLSAALESFPDGENAGLFPADMLERLDGASEEVALVEGEVAGWD